MPMTNNGENGDDNIIWSNLSTSGTNGIIKETVNKTPATTSCKEIMNEFEYVRDISINLIN